MKTDPDYFDAKIAGWWVWGISQWIGSGWCSKPEWRGRGNGSRANRGVHRQLPHLSNNRGVNAKRPMTGKGGVGVHRQLPRQDNAGVFRQVTDISGDGDASGRGVFENNASDLYDYMDALSIRLRRVRVCCGDWKRILGPSPTTKIGLTGVFLDPPYAVEERADIYTHESRTLALDVRLWALEHGADPELRIALCGYEGEHEMPESWECVAWKAKGGYANQKAGATRGKQNAHRERIWFSPHCLKPSLFGISDPIDF